MSSTAVPSTAARRRQSCSKSRVRPCVTTALTTSPSDEFGPSGRPVAGETGNPIARPSFGVVSGESPTPLSRAVTLRTTFAAAS